MQVKNCRIIRHSKAEVEWFNLSLTELNKFLNNELNPSIDFKELKRSIDKEKIVQVGIRTVYSSPLKRARETAEAIAEINKAEVVEVPELADLHFNPISKEIYKCGKNRILMELFRQGKGTTVSIPNTIAKDNSLLVSHGIIIVKLFMDIFPDKSIEDKYTKYLSGFCIDNGNHFTLSK